MTRKTLFTTVALLCGLVLAIAAGTASSAGVPKGQVDRVMADVYVNVVRQNWGGPDAIRLGVAHVTVQGWDVEPGGGYLDPTADVGSVSCAPAGSPQCGLMDGMHFLWMTFTDPQTALITLAPAGGPPAYVSMWVHDGGAPGNGPTGTLDQYGDPITNDQVSWNTWWISHPPTWGLVLSGNVTIKHY